MNLIKRSRNPDYNQTNLIEKIPDCPHHGNDGICYYFKNNPPIRYPQSARLFACPEGSRKAREECRLRNEGPL